MDEGLLIHLFDTGILCCFDDAGITSADKQDEWRAGSGGADLREKLDTTAVRKLRFADHPILISLGAGSYELLQKRGASGIGFDSESIQIQKGRETVANRRVAVYHVHNRGRLTIHPRTLVGAGGPGYTRIHVRHGLSLIHISEPTRQVLVSRMPSSA